jgi:hypothetical protein
VSDITHKTHSFSDERAKFSARIMHSEESAIVRELISAAEHHKLPLGAQLLEYLTSRADENAFRRILLACAHAPCSICRAGFEVCNTCAGKGAVSGTICEDCVAVGLIRCSFCGGSGRMAAESFPLGIRCEIMSARVELAAAHCREYFKPADKPIDDRAIRAACAREVIRWNRFLNVLENMFSALQSCAENEGFDPTRAAEIRRHCLHLAHMANRHIRNALLTFTNTLQPPANLPMNRRADFHPQFLARLLRSAQLDHPNLRKAALAAAKTQKQMNKQYVTFRIRRTRR